MSLTTFFFQTKKLSNKTPGHSKVKQKKKKKKRQNTVSAADGGENQDVGPKDHDEKIGTSSAKKKRRKSGHQEEGRTKPDRKEQTRTRAKKKKTKLPKKGGKLVSCANIVDAAATDEKENPEDAVGEVQPAAGKKRKLEGRFCFCSILSCFS